MAAQQLDLRAVGGGILWGLGAALAGGVIQGVISATAPLAPLTEARLVGGWQAVGCLVGGFLAARSAGRAGWLQGGAAGLGLVLVVTGLMGIGSAFPAGPALARAALLGTAVGSLAGMIGVNTRR